MSPKSALIAIKLLHTTAWVFFVGCIVAIPVCGYERQFQAAVWLSALVWAECAVLVLNGWRCPLTDLAARYTDAREDNFDIYLPLWLARHNKTIFGTVFVVGELFLAWLWTNGRWLHIY